MPKQKKVAHSSPSQLLPTGAYKAICELTAEWRAAEESWRSFVAVPRPLGIPVRLMLSGPPDRSIEATMFSISPAPEGTYREEILNHAGFQAFAASARKFATATESVFAILTRFNEPVETATYLVRHLRTPDPIPTQDVENAVQEVEGQLRRVEDRVWNCALPADEDLRERTTFWANERRSLQTAAALGTFDGVVATMMKHPRNPDHELVALNMASRLREEEVVTVPLAKILAMPRRDAASLCEVWRELVKFGFRFFEQNSSDPEKALFDFRALLSFPKSIPDSPAHRWVRELVAATRDLQPYVASAGISVDRQLALFELERGLERMMEREKVNLRPLVEEVQNLIKYLVHLSEAPRDEGAPGSKIRGRQATSPALPPSAESAAKGSVQATHARTLSGWPEILTELGLDPKKRKHKDWVKRTHGNSSGPIKILGGIPTATSTELVAWWVDLRSRSKLLGEESADRADTEQLRAESVAEMEDTGTRIEAGIHERSGPTRRKRGTAPNSSQRRRSRRS